VLVRLRKVVFIVMKLSQLLVALGLTIQITVAIHPFTMQEAEAHTVFGVVDKNGATVVPLEYKGVTPLRNGMFLLHHFDPANVFNSSKTTVVDSSGKSVKVHLPAGYNLIDVILPSSPNKLAEAIDALPKDTWLEIYGKAGLAICDVDGEFVLTPDDYKTIEYAQEGMFHVWRKSETRSTSNGSIFNARNHKIFPLKTRAVYSPYQHGLVSYRDDSQSSRRSGLLNMDGEALFERELAHVSTLSDGFALAGLPGAVPNFVRHDEHGVITSNSDPHQVYLNKDGQIVSPKFDEINTFSNGRAVVRLGDRYGLIDKTFKFVTSQKYSFLKEVGQNLYAAQVSGTQRFLTIDGAGQTKFEFPPSVFYIDSAADGIIICKMEPQEIDTIFGAFDTTGKLLWQTTAASIKLDEGSVLVGVSGKDLGTRFGLTRVLNRNGKPILELDTPGDLFPTSNGMYIKSVDDKKFHHEVWRDMPKAPWANRGWDRSEQFQLFLAQYNLISMSRKQVVDLLGEGPTYVLSGGFNHGGGSTLELEYAGDAVSRWRITGNAPFRAPELSPWINTNVLWQQDQLGKYDVRPK
jgi:hypothetical protein